MGVPGSHRDLMSNRLGTSAAIGESRGIKFRAIFEKSDQKSRSTRSIYHRISSILNVVKDLKHLLHSDLSTCIPRLSLLRPRISPLGASDSRGHFAGAALLVEETGVILPAEAY